MCGIIGAVSNRNVVPRLIDGMLRLEYRGYDSAGIAAINSQHEFERARCAGRVEDLRKEINNGSRVSGSTAIAHTRWATHGIPSEANAHPFICKDRVAIVCNGIIENYEELQAKQRERGFTFESETDTEVVIHELYEQLEIGLSLKDAVRETVKLLKGSYAFAALSNAEPEVIVVARSGSPLVVGLANNETFFASDIPALANFSDSIILLENGDIAEIATDSDVKIYDQSGQQMNRSVQDLKQQRYLVDLGDFNHFTQKEIFEQGVVIAETLERRISSTQLLEEEAFGPVAKYLFDETEAVKILACGTSFFAGSVARFWLESFGIPCDVEVASEFRSRKPVVPKNCLVVAISQSGETADTLSALAYAKKLGFDKSLAICNSPYSSLVRETDISFLTHAGPEVGVASTKAFTTQLVSLLLLTIALARRRETLKNTESQIVQELRALPSQVENALKLNSEIARIAEIFADKQHALFLGRGIHYPIAQEGALKLKEISYIHAESYPAGELKHGPLALVDSNMPTVAVAPNNHLLANLKANLQEVKARNGRLIVFSDTDAPIVEDELIEILRVTPSGEFTSPIIHTIALQLLAYHVAVIKGTDIDKPRNLSKSVTVE